MGFDIYSLREDTDEKMEERNRHIEEGLEKYKKEHNIEKFEDINELMKIMYNSGHGWCRSNPGYYFRANISWWPTALNFLSISNDGLDKPVLTDEDFKGMHGNNGYTISPEKTKVLGPMMVELINNEAFRASVEKRKNELTEDDDPLNIDFLEEFAEFVNNCNGFMVC